MRVLVIAALALLTAAAPRTQQPTIVLGPFDLILDTYVRDGYVYYRALKSERRRLDEYVRQIGLTEVDNRPKNEQLAKANHLEMILTELPVHLRRVNDQETGLALISLAA